MEILSWKRNVQKSHKNWFWDGLGLYVGRVWDSLGPLFGTLGRFLAVFGVFETKLLYGFGPRWSPRSLLDGCWVDFGGFGEDFGTVFRGFGEEFGRIWEIGSIFWKLWWDMALLRQIL